ncbi:glycosyltransferase [Bradyrhizobium guangzhouense]|uniref:glycosyltransferase n=1 Tax=Bradyrhizobium guangzhouense TaxID=1325095 RepID=UPI00100995C0|nr:glycosyltransferase [Bradyrhizobium guangzhouense]RXH10110.1 glycosyltransferase [Bradyrhizobium guangzhouense]
MNVLFVHNNFPAQYRFVARELAKDPANRVVAIGSSSAAAPANIRLIKYAMATGEAAHVHPFARRFELECRRAEEVLYSLSSLSGSGFTPDVIFAHPGWGETLPLRTMFPKAKIILYCEFFYGANGKDVGFDPEFPMTGLDGHVALHLKNASSLLALTECDLGIAPTAWQKSTFPKEFQAKIRVAHEGVDTEETAPDADAELYLPNGVKLTADDEVVTYVSRNLEPLRGFHIFMRALPNILRERPKAHVVIAGGDGTSYGARPPQGSTWKSLFFNEVRHDIDPNRVHFLGSVPREQYLRILQISSVHVYLTYPFVLSWSLLEAMSAGCLVVVSDTAPLRDAVAADRGVLVPFFDVQALSDSVIDALARPKSYQAKRKKARQHVVKHFDAMRVCLPELMKLVE